MIIDSSAVVAILQGEADARSLIDSIEAAASNRMSVASWVETSIVIESRYGAEGLRDLDRFVAQADIVIEPVDGQQGHLARDAFSRYGKGRHRAGLNFGDCFTYALTKLSREPLLCKGDDFVHTDLPIRAAAQ